MIGVAYKVMCWIWLEIFDHLRTSQCAAKPSQVNHVQSLMKASRSSHNDFFSSEPILYEYEDRLDILSVKNGKFSSTTFFNFPSKLGSSNDDCESKDVASLSLNYVCCIFKEKDTHLENAKSMEDYDVKNCKDKKNYEALRKSQQEKLFGDLEHHSWF